MSVVYRNAAAADPRRPGAFSGLGSGYERPGHPITYEIASIVKSPNPSKREQMLLFARNFLKHPKMLGSLIPSSRFLINEVLKPVDWKRARVLVEYGPGVGTISVEILRRMGPDAKLVVIEMNPDFARFLKERYRDPRLHVVHGSAMDVEKILKQLGLGAADYIVSGIPFSTMPDTVRHGILHATRSVLQPDGAFLVYQFSPSVLPELRRTFGHVDRGFELLNILPAHLFYCRPQAA
jgi:phospholipid N-methyltransferase